MPKIQYEDLTFRSKVVMSLIAEANRIIEDYQRQGYNLTLRQLYYRFVSQGIIPNTLREYKRLGHTVSKGRRAGLIDWGAIIDRTRGLRGIASWDDPTAIVHGAAASFHLDRWADQDHYVEVWIEKDALVGVFQPACEKWDVPFLSCRGYTSDSEVWGAAQRLRAAAKDTGRSVTVLHFGDHDPSGIDMTRDIGDRLALFGGPEINLHRIALNRDQVRQYRPPPNPAKESDSRYQSYVELHGPKCWELDALEPTVLGALVDTEITKLVDKKRWKETEQREAEAKAQLDQAAQRWPAVVEFLDEDRPDGHRHSQVAIQFKHARTAYVIVNGKRLTAAQIKRRAAQAPIGPAFVTLVAPAKKKAKRKRGKR